MKALSGRRRASALLLIPTLVAAAGALGSVLPVTAATSPEAAVEELLDRIDAGRTEGLDEIVCADEAAAVSALFDPVTAIGVSPDDPAARQLLDSIDYEVVDRSVSLLDRTDAAARVHLVATIRADLAPDTAEDLVRLMVATSGIEMSEQDVAAFVPLIVASLAEGQTLDEEVEVLLEDGSWRICGTPDEPPVMEATLTDAGICGLVSLAELDALAGTAYGANEGDESFCSWSSVAAEDYYFVNVSLFEGETLDGYRALFPEGERLRVGGRAAWSADGRLYVQAPEGVLLVAPFLEEGRTTAELDPRAYAISVAELILPRLPLLGPEPLGSPLP